MKKLRKILIASVMTLSVIAMSGFAALAPNSVSAAASAGDLIKMEGLSSVYYLGDDGKRYVFPNESTYFSWYSDFSGVVTIQASELQSYPLGGNVTMRPGTKLVKITTDPSVYAVESNGVLRKIQNESQAAALYGTNWNQRIVDIADSFFTNYTIGQPLGDGEIPEGTLVKVAGDATVYYYDGTNYRSIASEAAMNANRFKFSEIITLAASISATGNSITGMEADLVDVSQGTTTGPVVTGSGLMVSLNANTPASMNIPGDGISVEFMKVNLTAANDGPVNVSSITVSAHGLSDAGNIDNVTFYDNGVKVGTSKSINSNREATFNFSTPIYVAAGTTKTLTVKAEIASGVNSGTYGLGINKASHIVSSGATVTGSFPVNGNLMSAVEASVGAITITSNSTDTPSVNFGEDNVVLADFNIAAETESALLQSISLYNGGDNDANIVSNLKLFIDGEEVADGSYSDRYVIFSLDNYEVEEDENVDLEVRGDIGVTNAGDEVNLYIKDTTDVVAIGKTHGFSLGITITDFNESDEGITVTLAAGDFTIDMDKAATPAKDVKADDNDVVLATIKMTSNGEHATLTDIDGESFYITTNSQSTNVDDLLENIEMKDLSTGGVYDFTVATGTKTLELTLSEEISFVKDVTKTFELRADIVSTVDENETFAVTLAAAGMTIEGDVSGATITASPSSVTGSTTTVKDASLTVTPTQLTNYTVVGGDEDVIVYQAKVKAGTADGIRIQSLKLTSATSTEDDLAFIDDNVTRLSLWLNGKLLKEVSNQISGDTTGTEETTISFSSLNTANYTIPAGMEYNLVVTADFASNLTEGDFKLQINSVDDWTARSVEGNDSVEPNAAAAFSRIVTVAEAGTLTVDLNVDDSKAKYNSYVLAGSESAADRYLAEITFKTTNEDIRVDALTLTAVSGSTADNSDIAAVMLVDENGNVIATEDVDADGHAVFDPFDVIFDADKTTSLYVAVEAKGINVNGEPTSTATHGTTISYDVDDVEATGVLSGETIAVVDDTTDSMVATIVGVKLNSVVNAMSDSTSFTGGTKDLAKYTLVFDNGGNRNTNNEALKAVLDKFAVTFATSSATVTSPYLYVEGYSSDKAETGSFDGNKFSWSDLSDLVEGGQFDGSVTLVVAGTVTTTGDSYWVETSIADIDGSSTDDINYFVDIDGDGVQDSGEAVDLMLLPVTSVQGANLAK